MASEFDFLRMKWPKLAAMAADASRLADISPQSSVASLRTYSQWAADIALDLYEIQVAGGASLIEKLEALQASGLVPAEVLQKFHNIRSAGNRTLQDLSSSTELVHACLNDCRDIGQWLFREAEKEGWPRAEGYAPSYGRVPIEGLNTGGNFTPEYDSGGGFRMSKFMRRYGSFVTIGVVGVVIIGAIVGISMLFSKGCAGAKPEDTTKILSPTLAPSTAEPTPQKPVEPTPEPTAEPEPFDYIETLLLTTNFSREQLYFKQWDYGNRHEPFQMGGQTYEHGIGMFIPKDDLDVRGSQEAVWNLDGKYHKISFDLGVDTENSYDSPRVNGYFQVEVEADGTVIFDTGPKQTYEYYQQNIEKIISPNTLTLKIRLRQWKGEKGTLNVIMGDVKLYKNPDSEE